MQVELENSPLYSSSDFEVDRSKIIFDSNTCTQISTNFPNAQLIQLTIILTQQQQQICELKQINLNLSECAQKYDIIISSIEVNLNDNNKITKHGSNRALLQNTEIKLSGFSYIEINTIESTAPASQIEILNNKKVILSNSIFRDAKFDDKTGVLIKQADESQVQNCEFNDNTSTNMGWSAQQGAGLEIKFVKIVEIISSMFKNNSGKEGSGLQISDAGSNRIMNCKFVNNTADTGGGLLIVYSENIYVEGTLFLQNKCEAYGAATYFRDITNEVKCKNLIVQENRGLSSYAEATGLFYGESKIGYFEDIQFLNNICNCQYFGGGLQLFRLDEVYMNNLTFIGNTAGKGGAFYFHQVFVVNMFNCRYSNNTSTKNGGSIVGQMIYYKSPVMKLNLQNILIENSESVLGGAIYFTQLNCTACSLTNVTIRNSVADTYGAGIFLSFSTNITFQNVNFENNQIINKINQVEQTSGGGLYGEIIDNIYFNNLILDNNKAQTGQGFYCVKQCNQLYFTQSHFRNHIDYGTIQIRKSQDIFFISSQFYNNTNLFDGGAIYTVHVEKIQFKDCIFKENTGVVGGVLYFESTNYIILQSLLFKNNKAELQGGAIGFLNAENVDIIENEFMENFSQKSSGAMYVVDSRQISIKSSIFIQNGAEFMNGGITYENCKFIDIQDTLFKANTAWTKGGALNIDSCSNVTLNRIEVRDHTISRSGGGVAFQFTQYASIIDSVFYNNTSKQKDGGAIEFESSNYFNIKNSQFANNNAANGAALSLLGCHNFEITENQILQNAAFTQGGGIYMVESKDGIIHNNVFENNQATGEGGGVSILDSKNIEINKGRMYNNSCSEGKGGGIYIYDKCQQISIKSIQIIGNYARESGGGIGIQTVLNVTLMDLTFQFNKCLKQGSGVYVFDVESIDIEKCKFFDQNVNKFIAEYGGAIYLEQIKNVKIHQSQFDQNFALFKGGGVFLQNINSIYIQNTQLDSCKLPIKPDREQDLRKLNGGTLYVGKSDYFMIKDSEIKNGFSQEYGGGLYFIEVIQSSIENCTFIANSVQYDKNIPLYSKNHTYFVSQGGSIYYEPIMQNKQLSFVLKNSTIQNSIASSGGGLLLNLRDDQFIFFDFNSTTFLDNKADLGPAIRVLGGEQQNKIFQILTKDEKIIQESNVGIISKAKVFMEYYYNEKLEQKGFSQFQLCEAGYYLKKGGTYQCDKCHTHANCGGGYIPTYPKPKYWRQSKNHYQYQLCQNNEGVCKGNDTCQVGYSGILCENCDYLNGFAPEGQYNCVKCGSTNSIIINLIILFTVALLILLNQIYGVKNRISKRLIQKCMNVFFDFPTMNNSIMSGVMKIVIMHCQIIYLSAYFSVDFPFQVINFITIIGNPSKMLSQSLNCLVDIEKEEDVKTITYYISFYGLILTIGTVCLTIIGEILCYTFQKFIKEKNQLISYIKCSLICFFLTTQPGVLQNSLQFLTCRKIEDLSFSAADTNILCDEEFYQTQVLSINITLVILVVLIIPLIIGVQLFKGQRQSKMEKVYFMRVYGILYMDHSKQYFYFEFVTIITKILTVIISIVYQQQIIVRGSIVSIILVGYFSVCLYLKPFRTQSLNKLSILATSTQTTTIVLTMILFTMDYEPVLYATALVIIILLNIIFGFYSFYLIYSDFKVYFRSKILKHFKCWGRIQNKIKESINKEKIAKLRWKKIKNEIHQNTLLKRSGQKSEEMFSAKVYFSTIYESQFTEQNLINDGTKSLFRLKTNDKSKGNIKQDYVNEIPKNLKQSSSIIQNKRMSLNQDNRASVLQNKIVNKERVQKQIELQKQQYKDGQQFDTNFDTINDEDISIQQLRSLNSPSFLISQKSQLFNQQNESQTFSFLSPQLKVNKRDYSDKQDHNTNQSSNFITFPSPYNNMDFQDQLKEEEEVDSLQSNQQSLNTPNKPYENKQTNSQYEQ